MRALVRCKWVALALSVVQFAGCDATSPKEEPVGGVPTVSVSPSSVSLTPTQTQQFAAQLLDGEGNAVSGATVTWSSSNTGVASVSTGGLVTAVTVGAATLMATSDGTSGTATITVVPQINFVEAGSTHTCVLTTGGAAQCWGENSNGQLGDGTTTNRLTPVAVQGGHVFATVSSGKYHTCGRTSAGAAMCWGGNGNGQLGDGTTTNRSTPVAVQGGLVFTSLASAGEYHTCGWTSAGAAYCWGANFSGQLGDGTQNQRLIPVAVQGGLVFASLRAGGSHTCGLTIPGAAHCWGRNFEGQVGDGTSGTNRLSPVPVQGGLLFNYLTSGQGHTCGRTSASALHCWGDNANGQLGDGTTTNRLTPVAVQGGLAFMVPVEAGLSHTCALTNAGAAYCWGNNDSGRLGDGTTTHRVTPVAAQGGLAFTFVTLGDTHTCGRTSSGRMYCWGQNSSGQLGDGTTTGRLTPVAVVRQ